MMNDGRPTPPQPWVTAEGELLVDLTSPDTHAKYDLQPLYSFLRREAPVIWHPPKAGQSNGFWAVLRHSDATAMCRDAETYSSSSGNVIETLLYGGDPAGGQMLAVSDGPRHEEIRRLLWQGLTPDALRALSSRLRDNARAAITRGMEQQSCDFARDIAARLPLIGICNLLGVPSEDHDFILDCTSSALSSEKADTPAEDRTLAKAELLVYFDKLIYPRRQQPTADIVSVLVNGMLEERRLTDDEVVLNCYSLILGGDETTRLSLIGGIIELINDPDQWAKLKDGGISTKTAADEIVRWTTPAMHVGRTVTAETKVCDQVFNTGDIAISWLSSANFDEREFIDPGRFDMRRRPNRHLGFSNGSHFCVGAHLARLEITILLETLRELVNEIELVGEPHRVYSNFLSGFSSLPVRMA